jgi:hypothetical protein
MGDPPVKPARHPPPATGTSGVSATNERDRGDDTTLGTTTSFVGNLIALQSITLNHGFAADLFFCGSIGLEAAVEEIRWALRPEHMSVSEIQRLPPSRLAPSPALVER